jgi:hypothetical protein
MYEQLVSMIMFVSGVLLISFNRKLAQRSTEASKPARSASHKFFSEFGLGFLFPDNEEYDNKLGRFGMIFCGIILILWALGNLFGPFAI